MGKGKHDDRLSKMAKLFDFPSNIEQEEKQGKKSSKHSKIKMVVNRNHSKKTLVSNSTRQFLKWFTGIRSENIPVTGILIKNICTSLKN